VQELSLVVETPAAGETRRAELERIRSLVA